VPAPCLSRPRSSRAAGCAPWHALHHRPLWLTPVLGNASAVAAWRAAMQVLAAGLPDVVLKAGGLLQYYEAGGALPSVAQMAPFATAGLQAFGWDRSLVEYNWCVSPPPCLPPVTPSLLLRS